MIRAILRTLSTGNILIFQERMPEWGFCERWNHSIFIRSNLSMKNKVRTLIHECIHYRYPHFEEDTVLLMERDLYKHLNSKEFEEFEFYLK